MTRRFILTGAPGAGKTALIRQLEFDGEDVVEEAATDIIALRHANGFEEEWRDSGFVASIARLQSQRERAPARGQVRFADRSVFCTLALADYLGHPRPPALEAEAERLLVEAWFERQVLFIEMLPTITHTDARRISYDDARRFGAMHADLYRSYGFELVPIPPAPIDERIAMVRRITGG